MTIDVLKSKVHRAVITEANLNYVGSLTLDEDLMDAANMIENEKNTGGEYKQWRKIGNVSYKRKAWVWYLLPEWPRRPAGDGR